MDENNLMDFTSPKKTNRLISPLIPLPDFNQDENYLPRLSNVFDNPFDTVLRKATLNDDPFEQEYKFTSNDIENKENIGSLVSPFKTQMRSKSNKRLSMNSLLINNCTPKNVSFENDSVFIDDDNSIGNQSSLQCLSDSMLIDTGLTVPDSISKSESAFSPSILNRAFIDRTQKCSTKSSNSTFSNNVVTPDISNIIRSTSTVCSKDIEDPRTLNCAFLKDSDEGFVDLDRNCKSTSNQHDISAKESALVIEKLKLKKLNNSFGGFDFKSRKLSFDKYVDADYEFCTKDAFKKRSNTKVGELSSMIEPWYENDLDFIFQDNEQQNEEPLPDVPQNSQSETTKPENVSTNSSETNAIKNATALLQNLTGILQTDGHVVDQRTFGETLLNTLALALNIESPVVPKTKELKSEEKNENVEHVPKIMVSSAAPVKSVKLRNEKEKVPLKGPLKAVIPLKNMARNNKSLTPTITVEETTPPKCAQAQNIFQNKKTSTPYELKLKPPIAQSTPETNRTDTETSSTPSTKRRISYSSSLPVPSKSLDIINESTSSKGSSNGSNSFNKSSTLPRQSSHLNTSATKPAVTTMNRRKSSSDIKSTEGLNRSCEKQKKTLLKRSSSFQYKRTESGQNSSKSVNSPLKKIGSLGSKLKAFNFGSKVNKCTTK